MNVTTIAAGSTGQSLEGVAVSTGVRESVILTSPSDPLAFAEIVSTQPISFYGLPVWLQGTLPGVNVSTFSAGSIPVTQSSGPWAVNGGISVTNAPNVNVTNVPAVNITSSIPFFVAQSSSPWAVNGAIAVTSNVTVQGTSSVNVISSAAHAIVGTVSTQIVSSIPFFVAQSSAPWSMNVPGTTMVFVVSSVAHAVVMTSSSGAKTSVGASTASVTVLAANAGRKGATIWNDSVVQCYLDESGGTASSNSFTAIIPSQNGYVVDAGYTGAITGVWTSTTGNARVTEFT